MCAAFASRVCAALPFALVLTLAAFSQLPGRSESTIALLQNAAYPDVADAAATFGPRIPRAGLTGTLFLAAPLEGCAPLAKHPGGPWIALMERSEPSADCGFITKVRHAEAAGAIAAVVYDYVEGPLIPMARPDDDQGPDAGIPSVFVTASGGRVLRAALSGPLGGALITLRAPQTFGDWPSLLAGAFVACLVASAALSATCGGGGPGGNDGDDAEAAEARRRRRDRERLLTAAQIVAATETCVFSSADASIGADGDTTGDGSTNGDGSAETGTCGAANNGTRTTCTVCLEEYEDGDRLRVLACEHAFHEACIDPWLRTKRACCPFCKADVRPPPKKRRGRRGRSANANEGANANERGANDVDAEAGGAAADADDDDLAAPLLRRAEERPSHEEEGEAAAEGGRRRRRWGLRAMRDVLGSVVRPLARRGPRGGPRAAASDDDDDGAGREDAVVDLEAGEAEAGAGASDA